MESIDQFITSDRSQSIELDTIYVSNKNAKNERQESNSLYSTCERVIIPRRSGLEIQGKGKTTDVSANVAKKLNQLIQQYGQEIQLYSTQKPKKWNVKSELIYLCLKCRSLDLSNRNILIAKIKQILNKMIQFRTKRIHKKKKNQFYSKNRDLLLKIKQICLRLLQNPTIPQPSEIHSMLRKLIHKDNANPGNQTIQSLRISEGYQYILRQFPQYFGQNGQNQQNGQNNFRPILNLNKQIEKLIIDIPLKEPMDDEYRAMEENFFNQDSCLSTFTNYGILYFGREDQDQEILGFGMDSQPQQIVIKEDFEEKYSRFGIRLANISLKGGSTIDE